MQNEIYIFIAFILNGFLIGIIFDCFRILRKSFKTPDIVTYIEDVLFGITTGLIVLYSIFKFNNGELRLYLFLGIFIGILLYLLIFSKIFMKISIHLILFLKKIINFIIIIPLKNIYKFFKKVFIKPVIFICINFTNALHKVKIHPHKLKSKKSKL